MSGISVECLKKITFSLLPLSEKLEIITRGRPTPNIFIHTSRINKSKRYFTNFNHDWYEKIEWLCGCDTSNSLFCFPCLLFGGDTVWTQNGFTSIRKMKEKTEKHQNSRRHMANVISLSLLSQINVSEGLGEASKILKNDKEVEGYREDLSKVIDCLKFSGKFELYLRHQGNGLFNKLEKFASSFDAAFRNHILIFGETSETVQNDLLRLMLDACREHIISEIEEVSCVSVICEDVSDMSEKIQTLIVFRYVHMDVIRERFWGFIDSSSVIKDGLFNCLLKELNKVLKKDRNKLIAQTFGGPVKGEGIKVQDIYPNAHFIQICSNDVDATLKQMTQSVKSVRLFFADLACLDKFFKKNPARLSVLYKHIKHTVPQFNSLDVCTVYKVKNSLIKCFGELLCSRTTDKTLQASARFLSLLKNENFLFWLDICNKIIFHLELFYQNIQSNEPEESQQTVHEFCKLISRICNSVSFKSAGSYKILECQELSSCICDEIKEQFAFTGHLATAKLFDKENFELFHSELPIGHIQKACTVYPEVIEEKLKRELRVFYSQKKFQNIGPLNILNSLNNESLLGAFSEIIKLLKILLTIPMTLTKSERSFSTVEKVKSCIRDTVNEKRLTALCMLSVESEMVNQIKNFNEKVVQKYCHSRKFEFALK